MIAAQVYPQILYKHLSEPLDKTAVLEKFFEAQKESVKVSLLYHKLDTVDRQEYDMSNLLKHTLRRWFFSKSGSRKTIHQMHSCNNKIFNSPLDANYAFHCTSLLSVICINCIVLCFEF